MDAAWTRPFVAWPGPDSPVSLTTWAREVREFLRTALSSGSFPDGAARGHGEPVFVIPAFLSPESSAAFLCRFLAHQGFAAACWGCGMNLGPTRATIQRLDARLRAFARDHGRKVSLVGISLGGTLAREAAKRCPECTERVVTLASPVNVPVTTPLAPLARLAAMLWDGQGDEAFEHVGEAPPVPLTAVVCPNDGVVESRACLPRPGPGVETVLVPSPHMTIATNPEALRVVAARLAAPPG